MGKKNKKDNKASQGTRVKSWPAPSDGKLARDKTVKMVEKSDEREEPLKGGEKGSPMGTKVLTGTDF